MELKFISMTLKFKVIIFSYYKTVLNGSREVVPRMSNSHLTLKMYQLMVFS
jgi:HJR/Mrr/RecB family endonuclease